MYKTTRSIRLFIILIAAMLAVTTSASDLAKEKRWAEQVVGDLFDGEAIFLNDGTTDFLALSTIAEEPGETALVIMHGIGVHPDWPLVINPLRVSLAEKGWSNLSIQLPILGNDAEPADYEPLMTEVAPRINAAVARLNQDGYKRIVLIAHSMGARMASYFLTHSKNHIIGFAGVGMNTGNAEPLKNINIPVLDIYGEYDLDGVLSSSPARKAASVNNADYLQRQIPGADHFFEGNEDQLIDQIATWLESI